MFYQVSKTFLVVITLGVAFTVAACGAGDSGEDIEPVDTIEAQTTPETEKQAEPVEEPTPLPTPTNFPTEITEPEPVIEPVSPVRKPAMAPTTGDTQPLPGSEKALAAAVADLTEQTGVPAGEIRLVSMEAVDWSDSSLGCPQEGYMYAQVITPGFLIILEAEGQQYEYHTDQAGNVVLCEA